MRHVNSKKGLYTHVGGVAWPGSGLEIKERGKTEDDKPKLKGFFSPRGWHATREAAVAAAEGDYLLREFQKKAMR